MTREQVQRIVLTIVGVLFLAAAIPGVMFFASEPSVPMLMSLYVTLGIFLLLASRNPSAHRLLIAYAAWANIAHASVMALQEYWHIIQPRELVGVTMFGIIGIALVATTPAKEIAKQVSAPNAA